MRFFLLLAASLAGAIRLRRNPCPHERTTLMTPPGCWRCAHPMP
jgi:hypothetical protein